MKLNLLKKFVIGATIASMMVGLVACSSTSGTTTTKSGNDSTKKIEKKEKESKYKDLKVGVLLIGSNTDTSGYSYAHAQGVRDAIKNLGMSEDQIIWKNAIPDAMDNASDAQVIEACEACIKEGCQIIFTTSFGYKNATNQLATKYPDVYFAHG